MMKQAADRDHRKIGREMNLFTFSDMVGSGLPMFTPKGTAMRNAIVAKIAKIQEKYGFQEVWIPHITKPELYMKSGHWEKFGDDLFKVKGRENDFVMKPMNCPHHTQIFASAPKSYKDLPVRYSETTTVYRDEQAGELLGLSRVRSLTQDDGHTFCTPEQIEVEIKNIINVMREFYTSLDLWSEGKYQVFLSVRDPKNPEKYLGSDEVWNQSETVLKKIAKDEQLPYTIEEGEAAFYGPKLDFKFKDSIGRVWQLATVQLDFNMPARFELEYTDSDGTKKTPVMIHRAIAGSLERFLSVIIEHYAGNFPTWMAPVQVKVLPIAENHNEKASEIYGALKDAGFRVELDDSKDGLGKKVRNAKKEKTPYFVVIGDKDIEENKITIESRDNGNLGMMTIEEFVEKITAEVK
jgi:threonyl-tRNA synthetase